MNNIEEKTFGEKIREWANLYTNSIAMEDDEKKYTYLELMDNSLKMSNFFLDLGIKKGDNVLVQLTNSTTLIFSILGLAEIGAAPILVLPAHRENEINGITKVAKPVAYLSQEMYMEEDISSMAKEIKEKHECIKNLVFQSELEKIIDNDNYFYDKKRKYETPSPSDIAILLLSGGTTGIPKLIPRTHKDYIYNNKMASERCKITNKDVYLACMPIAHNFTLGCPGIFGTFYVGGKVIISNSTTPLEIFDYISEKKVTFTSMVPSIALMCTQMLEWDDSFDLSSIKSVLVGGAVLERQLACKIVDLFKCNLIQVFGTAEGLICCTSIYDDFETIVSTQGKPISPYDEIRIVDENDNEVEVGELITKGPYTIKGYYKLEEVNKTCFTKDGFYRTGDKARFTKEGNIQILGRIKEQINRAGEKIMPHEIEENILSHNDVTDCAVVGIKDEVVGNSIYAFIIANREITLDEMKKFLKDRKLAEYKMPDKVVRLDKFPLTAVGKVDKKSLALEVSK